MTPTDSGPGHKRGNVELGGHLAIATAEALSGAGANVPAPRTTHRAWRGRAMRTVHAGPVIGLIAQVVLLAALADTVGLGGAGWIVGITCGVITDAALAHGLSTW